MPQASTAPAQVDTQGGICPYCHQPILPTFYFCPNCGTKLTETALSTSPGTQAWIYAFSIVLPMLCYLFITKWPAWKYFKSKDPEAHQIGLIAITLLVLSTIVTLWLSYQWTMEALQDYTNTLNQQLSGY